MKKFWKSIEDNKDQWRDDGLSDDWDAEEYEDGDEEYYEESVEYEDGGEEYYEESAEYEDSENGEYYEESTEYEAQDQAYKEFVTGVVAAYYEDGDEYYEEQEDSYGDIEYFDDAEYEDAAYDEYYSAGAGGLLAWFSNMTAMDKVMLGAGVCVLFLALITSVVFLRSRNTAGQSSQFASVGTRLEGIDIIGDEGLLAVANAAAAKREAAELVGQDQNQNQNYNEAAYNKEVNVVLKMVSVQKDLKIKFVNQSSDKLISNVPFVVTVTTADNKTESWSDDDMDGIIYKKGITPGSYQVTVNALSGEKYDKYHLPAGVQKAEVKKDIAYQKIDVSDEVKTESEVNVATEEQKKMEPEVESSLTDTVEWVESTAVTSTYIEVAKGSITDPLTLTKSGTFLRTAKEVTLNRTEEDMTVGGRNLILTLEHSFEEVVSIDWKSSNNSVAEVDADGVVTAMAAGKATITCTVRVMDGQKEVEYTAKCEVKVTDPSEESSAEPSTEPSTQPGTQPSTQPSTEPSTTPSTQPSTGETSSEPAISVDYKSVTLKEKGTETVLVTVRGFDTSRELVYNVESDDTSVATAEISKQGKITITGKRVGSATLTAWANYKSNPLREVPAATIEVKVTEAGDISLSKMAVTVYVNSDVTIKVTLADGFDGDIDAESSDKEVAKVKVDGTSVIITGVKPGTAKITVSAEDGGSTLSETCAVTVKLHPKDDSESRLKDNNGNQLFVQENGSYREALYADYYKDGVKFFRRGETKYTGWQTIDGRVYFFDKTGKKVTGEQVIQGAKYNFGSDGALITGSGIMGIDVSKHNGTIDWPAVKNSGVSYVIIRCGYRGYTQGSLIVDPRFEQNIKGATSAGLKVGVYFFSQAIDEVEAVEEASFVLDAVKGYNISYPIFLDVEYSGASGNKGRADGLDKATRTAVCKAFCATIRSGGYNAGVYANKTWLQTMIDPGQLSAYKIWLAQYAAAPTYDGRYDMWQYKSTGRVSGISGNVDMNLSYLGY